MRWFQRPKRATARKTVPRQKQAIEQTFSIQSCVIITKIKSNKVYIFDPYYLDKNKYVDKGVKIVLNKPFEYNRVVSFDRVFSESDKDFSLGKMDKRECVLFKRI